MQCNKAVHKGKERRLAQLMQIKKKSSGEKSGENFYKRKQSIFKYANFSTHLNIFTIDI